MSDTEDGTIRRLHRGGVLGESVSRWHHEEDGPGLPGGRTYDILYFPEGGARIDVSGCWSSMYHTVILTAQETRPREEYIEHLICIGRSHPVRAYCADCGREKAGGAQGSCPEGCRPPKETW